MAGPIHCSNGSAAPDWVKFILDRPMSSVRGYAFNYNSGNTHLLSAIITKLSGMSVLEYAKAKLFGPLGINDVSWQHDPQGISNGGYGLYLQPRDMAKVGYLYLRDGSWEGKQLLPPAWIDKVSHATVNMTHWRRDSGIPTFSGLFRTSMSTWRSATIAK